MKSRLLVPLGLMLVALGGAAVPLTPAKPHCDGLDGPVVKAARSALASGDVNFVLIWVREADEPEIRQAFERTLAVRELSDEARELADTYFFETLVRVHRAGEGAPYTGLKPAGRDLGPAIPLADRALETGDVAPLVNLITNETRRELVARFEHVVEAGKYPPEDIEAGREYVEAYVTFIHFVEGVHEAAHQSAAGHYPEHTTSVERSF